MFSKWIADYLRRFSDALSAQLASDHKFWANVREQNNVNLRQHIQDCLSEPSPWTKIACFALVGWIIERETNVEAERQLETF